MASRSSLIQFLTILQISFLGFVLLDFLCYAIREMQKNSSESFFSQSYVFSSFDFKIPALVTILLANIILVSCSSMKKVSLHYLKWRVEKTGRFLFEKLTVVELVSWCRLGTIQVLRHHVLTFLGPPTQLFDGLQYCKSSRIVIFWPHPPTSLMT